MGIASYLPLTIVGDYTLTSHTAPGGITYYQVQDTDISAKQRAANAAVMNPGFYGHGCTEPVSMGG